MKTLISWLPQIVLVSGIWTALNGILHTIAVLASEHGKHYDRDLLRLLTDGLLLTSFGTVLMLCFSGLKSSNLSVHYIALSVCAAAIVYCMLIWPFLKSVGTLSIHTFTFVCIILALFNR